MKVFLNSMPKSGTNMLSRLFDLHDVPYDNLGISQTLLLGNYYFVRQMLRRSFFESAPVNIGLDVQMPLRRAWLSKRLAKVRDRHYITGHANWSPVLEDLLGINQIKTIVIVRNPADTLLSHVHYIATTSSHFLHNAFKDKPLDEAIIMALRPGVLGGKNYLGFAEMLHKIWRWKIHGSCLVVKFEDLVGSGGGGTDEAQERVVGEIGRFLKCEFSAENVKANLYGESKTFRKGKIGSAHEEVNAEVLELVKSELSASYAMMGYALD